MKAILLFFQNFNPNTWDYATPYDSTQGMSLKMQLTLCALILIFGLYTVYKVRKKIKEDQKKME
ncbi:MAG: hypothetical protein KA138_05820 [Saprospiraceae bacterium]|nr:hypothetical protein [Saprospiraceae bacterium]